MAYLTPGLTIKIQQNNNYNYDDITTVFNVSYKIVAIFIIAIQKQN